MALPRQGFARGIGAVPSLSSLVLGSLLAAAPARAQITTLEEAPTTIEVVEPFPWLVIGATAIGGLHTYGMEQMNKAVELVNDEIVAPGVSFTDFSGGPSMGGGVRAILKERLLFEANFERFFASKEIGGTAKSKLSLPANAYVVSVGWDLMKKRRVGFGVEAGAGYYDVKGEQALSETSLSGVERSLGSLKFEGNGIGIHGGAYLERALSKRVWVNFFAGYRSARIKDISITGLERLTPPEVLQNRQIIVPIADCPDCPGMDRANRDFIPDSIPEGAKVTFLGGGDELDYSGVMGRMGLTWYLNAPEE